MSPGKILRTAEAIADLDGIWDYIARDNPTAADKMLDEFNERFVLLSKNPGIGELHGPPSSNLRLCSSTSEEHVNR